MSQAGGQHQDLCQGQCRRGPVPGHTQVNEEPAGPPGCSEAAAPQEPGSLLPSPGPVMTPPAGEPQLPARRARALSEPHSQMQFVWSGLFDHSRGCRWLSCQPPFSGLSGAKRQGQPAATCALKGEASASPPRTRPSGVLITRVLEKKVVSVTVRLALENKTTERSPCFPELRCTAFFSSSSVSRPALVILVFFAPLHILQPKLRNRRSKPAKMLGDGNAQTHPDESARL